MWGFVILAVWVGALINCRMPSPIDQGWNRVPVILKNVVPPVFPKRDVLITDYGAIGDGKTDCTQAFARAIDVCHRAGGGRVIVPKGIFLTGAIHLKSNVNLHLLAGATIRFSRNKSKYLPVVFTRFEGVECLNYSPFVYAYGQNNVAVTGEGILDGQADSLNWWNWTRKLTAGRWKGHSVQTPDRNRLFEMAEKGVPVEKRVFGPGHFLRVNFIQFYRCKNVLIEGITLKRSPMWVLHPVLSENVLIRDVTVDSHGPNNDGCDPESSNHVVIENSRFNDGDDCIAIKSGRNADGRRVGVPSSDIVIRNCRMQDGHGGVVIGSEVSGNVHDVFVENCTMSSPNLVRAIRIKTNSLRGGLVENIYVRNVTVGQVKGAVLRIDMFYSEGDVGHFTPIVRDVFVRNLISEKSRYALILKGYARSPITNVWLEQCRFNGVAQGNIIQNVRSLHTKQVTINGKAAETKSLLKGIPH